jgi:cobalt-zinc-cadmium efflux system protein
LIAGFILYSTLKLLREAVHGLMEGVPLNLSLANIGQSMAERPGVLSVHDLHVWSLSSQKLALSAHIVIDDLLQWDRILDDLSNMLREQHDIGHVTLQPENATRVITFSNRQHSKNTEPPAD